MTEKEARAFYDVNRIKDVPIDEVCRSLGITFTKRSGTRAMCMLRSERTASAQIYFETNSFYDYGANVGGDVIDLVRAVKGYSFQEAVQYLADEFGIANENERGGDRPKGSAGMSARQYEKIGISPDKATDNFNVDMDRYSRQTTQAFMKKYDMSIWELAKQYPKEYANVIKHRAIPFVAAVRNDYYYKCWETLKYKVAMDNENISDFERISAAESYAGAVESLKREAADIENRQKWLASAIDDKELVRTPQYFRLSPESDMTKIENGIFSFEHGGTISYATLKQGAAADKEQIRYSEVDASAYGAACLSLRVGDVPFAAFFRGSKVNICCYDKDLNKLLSVIDNRDRIARAEALRVGAIISLSEDIGKTLEYHAVRILQDALFDKPPMTYDAVEDYEKDAKGVVVRESLEAINGDERLLADFESEQERTALRATVEEIGGIKSQSEEVGEVQTLNETQARLCDMNRIAADYYADKLFSAEGENALKYLHDRGLNDDTIKKFGIGYAGKGAGAGLIDILRAKGYDNREELIASGLFSRSKNNDGLLAFFRERAVFPVVTPQGNVVAFSGRTIDGDNIKYLNTKETEAFKKGNVLFGLNVAKLSDTRQIIITEGQMDAIALHSAGFDNAVAGLGTALTEEQARLISHYADEVVLAYDADEAGRKATARTVETFKGCDVTIKAVEVTGVKDADEFIQKFGADKFRQLLSNATVYVERQMPDAILIEGGDKELRTQDPPEQDNTKGEEEVHDVMWENEYEL